MNRKKKHQSSTSSGVHPGEVDSQLDSQGHVMTTAETIWKRKKAGKCTKCGLVTTHKKSLLRMRPETVYGVVYKGYCLRCHTLMEAKLSLNEPVETNDYRGTNTGPSRRRDATSPTSVSASGGSPSNNSGRVAADDGMNRQTFNSVGNATLDGSEGADQHPSRDGKHPCDAISQQLDSHEEENTVHLGDVDHRALVSETHRAEEEEYTDPSPRVPSIVDPRRGGLQRDVSELTIDTTDTTGTGNSGSRSGDGNFRIESLGQITEENTFNDSIAHLTGAERMYERIRAKNAEEQRRVDESAAKAHLHKTQETLEPSIESESNHTRSRSDTAQGSLNLANAGHVRSKTEGDALIANRNGGSHSNNSASVPRVERVDKTASGRGQMSLLERKLAADKLGADRSNNSASIPRVECVDKTSISGRNLSLYERKLAGENVCAHENSTTTGVESATLHSKNPPEHNPLHHHDHQSHHITTSKPMSESQARLLITECAKHGKCGEIMDLLKSTPPSPAVVIMALEGLRDGLAFNHVQVGRSGSTVSSSSNRGWLKIVTMNMSPHSTNQIVQLEGLRTIWAIIALCPHCMSQSGPEVMGTIVSAMDFHADAECVQESGCGLAACMAASQVHALRLLEVQHGSLLQRLMEALYFCSRKGSIQEHALKALFRLSSAHLSSGAPIRSFNEMMVQNVDTSIHAGNASTSAMNATFHSMQQHPKKMAVQIWGTRLLWNIFSSDILREQDAPSLLVSNILDHLQIVSTSHPDSLEFRESVICFLSKISRYSDCLSKSKESFSRIAVEIMISEPRSWIVALNGCRCIYNICTHESTATSSRSVVTSMNGIGINGIGIIITVMTNFPEHISVQGEACIALAALCAESPSNKKAVMQSGGIPMINRAFDSYIASKYEGGSLCTKIRACTVLTTLVVDPVILNEIREAGILKKFEQLLEDETSKVPAILQQAMQRMLSSCCENDENTLGFREGANQEESCHTLMANLNAIIPLSVIEHEKALLLRYNILRTLEKFPMRVDVLDTGLKLLACVYGLMPAYSAGDIHELETITQCMMEHKTIPSVVASAYSALRNFCARGFSLDSNDQIFLSELMSNAISDTADILELHRDDPQVLEDVFSAIWAFCALKKGLALKGEGVNIAIESMVKFPESIELQRNCIGVLLYSFSVSNTTNFVSENFVGAVVRFLEFEEDDDAIDIAINAILAATKKGFQAVMAFLKNDRYLDSIVSCMFKYIDSPHSSSIQCASFEILSNSSLDNYIRADICSRGGTSRVIFALDNFSQDRLVVCKALSALANLISGTEVEILRGSEISKQILNAMQLRPDDLMIQILGAAAIWTLASRHDVFKGEIVQLGGARIISEAMNRFLACEIMQSKGFISLWSLAVRPLKAEIGRYAVHALNGLAAHPNSEKICEEGIGLLKCLTLHSQTKMTLQENGALDLIFSLGWIHPDNSTIIQADLAAISNLSVNVEMDQVVRINSDDLEVITHAMRTHQRAKGVQECAMILLRNYTCSPSNCLVLQGDCFLVGLVRAAMVHFSGDIQGRARIEDLLQVLPSFNQ